MSVENVVHVVSMDEFLVALWRPRLVARRRQLGWRQTTLAAVIDKSHQTVKFWEQDRRTPKRENLIEWRDALGM